MRKPSPEEIKKERSVVFVLVTDILIIVIIVLFAFATGSLSLISECVRTILMYLLTAYLFVVLRGVHRDSYSDFEFGVAKLEHFACSLLGLGLVVSGLWIAHSVIDAIFGARPVASPAGLAIAAVVNSINTLINVINWLVVRARSSRSQSEVFTAQLDGRRVMMTTSLCLQVTMTVAALARDPLIALCLDAAGAGFVCLIMFRGGFMLIGRSLPILLDARAPLPVRAAILENSRRELAGSKLLSMRTKRDGDGWIAEARIVACPVTPLAEFAVRRQAIEERLRHAGHTVRLSILGDLDPAAPDQAPGGSSDDFHAGDSYLPEGMHNGNS